MSTRRLPTLTARRNATNRAMPHSITKPNTVGRMALLHEATLTPRKDEVIAPWLRTRPWWDGVDDRSPSGSFRLDDPAGEVGIECFLLGSAAGSTLFVPATYRSAPLAG